MERIFYAGSTTYRFLVPACPAPAELQAYREMKEMYCACFKARFHHIDIAYDDGSFTADDEVISIGNTSMLTSSGLMLDERIKNTDGYMMKTVGNAVIILTDSEAGKLYAVYELMHIIMGYEYYAKDEIYFEEKEKYLIPDIDLVDVPTFMGRSVDSYTLYKDLEYVVRMRQNGYQLPYPDYDGEGSPWASLNDQSMAFQLIPRSVYKDEEHIKKGWWSEKGDQLCWTKCLYDEEMYALFRDHFINNFVAVEKNKKFFMLGQTDNLEYCNCPVCQKDYAKYGGQSGVLLRLVNRLARDTKNWAAENQPGREIYLSLFGYLYTSKAPLDENGNTLVLAEDNVMVRLAPLQSVNMYPHTDAVHNPVAAESFAGWSKVCKHLAVWDYGTDFVCYMVPYPDWTTIQKNLRMYRKLGVMDLFTQVPAHCTGTEFFAMKIYVRSKMMWNVDLDYDTLVDDFMTHYYKEAKPYILQYYALLKKHYDFLRDSGKYTGGIYALLDSAEFWDFELIEQFEGIFRQALVKISEIKTQEPQKYQILAKRLRTESLFYRMMQLHVFRERYSQEQFHEKMDSFERDSWEAGLVAYGRAEKVINSLYLEFEEWYSKKERR